MSKSDGFENDFLKLIFQGTTITGIAVNDTGTPFTQLGVALHTADPGETGTQTTSEATYTSYARVNVNRNSAGSGWTVASTGSVSPQVTIAFPACTGGTNTITHFSVGPPSGGAGRIYYSGTVTPNISVSSGVTPQLTTASTITED